MRGWLIAGLSALTLAAPAAASAAEAVSPARLALARELVEAAGGQENMSAMAQQMSHTMLTGLGQGMPDAPEPVVQAMRTAINATLEDSMPDLVSASVEIYAQTFTDDELKAMTQFYRTPAGRAMVQKMPALGARLGTAMAPLQVRMKLGVLARFCAQVACPDTLKTQIDALRAVEAQNR